MLWSTFPNCRRQFGLNSVPAVTVSQLGFVQNLNENAIGIVTRIVLRQRPPVIGKLLNEAVVRQLRFEIAIRMNVDDYRKAVIEDHLHRGIQIIQIIVRNFIGMAVAKHRRGIHAQADVIKSHCFYQRNVRVGGPVLKMLRRVSLRIVNLGKPFAQVNAMTQIAGATLRDLSR